MKTEYTAQEPSIKGGLMFPQDSTQQAHDTVAAQAIVLPTAPKTIRDTGLDRLLLVELVAKSIFIHGRTGLSLLASKLKLSINVLNEVLAFMVAEHLAEVVRRGESDIDIDYQLSGAGKQRAAEYMAGCRYVGPAPVTLDAYSAMVARQ